MPRKAQVHRHGLADLINHELPESHFSGLSAHGNTRWMPQTLAWAAVLMTFSAATALKDRFAQARRTLTTLLPAAWVGTTYRGFSAALSAWSVRLLAAVLPPMRRSMQVLAGRYFRVQGWAAFAFDGSKVELPRTDANIEAYGDSGKPGSAPQLLLSVLYHMGLGVPWNYFIEGGNGCERTALRLMLDSLPADALLVADAGITGYELLREILESGRSFLIRVGANIELLRRLGHYEEKDDTVYLWPDAAQKKDKPPLVLRQIRLQFARTKACLLTNVVDASALSDEQAGVLYRMRWGVEVLYRSFKQTLGKRKLRSDSPRNAVNELYWSMLGLWLLELAMVRAKLQAGLDPLDLSVASALRAVREAMHDEVSAGALKHRLAQAAKDEYVRKSKKAKRPYPRKKRHQPPKLPKIRRATQAEIRKAQVFMSMHV